MRNLHGDGDCRCDPRRRTRLRAGFRQRPAGGAEGGNLRNEVEALKGDVAEGREEARGATGQMAAAKTEPPADAPSIRVSSSNQPTICSSDGRNCIPLTSRLQLDFGGYNYRPNTIATTPQALVGRAIAHRAQFAVIRTFMDAWESHLVFAGGGSGGAPQAGFAKE